MKKLFLLTPLLALLVGCATTSKITPALVQQGVATGVAYGAAKYPQAVPYLRAADAVICSAANGTNIAPTEVVAALESAGLAKTPEGVLILNGALTLYIGVWQGYGADAVNKVPELKLYLQATCSGIKEGLPMGAARLPSPAKASKAAQWPVVRYP